ncbi:MAG: AbrB family transcriptional regulator [Sediminimonas qiaohouensis]|uniref:AbrB family transcriptional regulator n=2 Tax=Sediminimonas qiaohouensis TaxID=552061 RepID=A0A7C9LN58_9RHOB|nr:AbrB family transcriptional regulator [Sediminimonas qiaohouensis]
MIASTHLATLILICLGAIGGAVATLTPLPLPFMLGSLIMSAAVAIMAAHRLPAGYLFPQPLRLVFIAAIGVMIGAQVTPDLAALIPSMAISLAALTLFVGLAHAGNFAIFHHLGGYDRSTAFYSGTPGGLMESIAMGEDAGADVAVIGLQQFLRIILVITFVPVGLSIWYGAPVGSASGASLAPAQTGLSELPLVAVAGGAGLWLGLKFRLPAGQLTGPLFVAAVMSLSGIGAPALPDWLIHAAQIVIGTSLGLRFTGLARSDMMRALWLGLMSVTAMLALGTVLALAVHQITETAFDVALISLAPGGVTEMALVALSLNANPAIVSANHIYRIILTVIEISILARIRRYRDNSL